MKRWHLILAAMSVLSCGLAVQVPPSSGYPRPLHLINQGKWWKNPMIVGQLGLTNSQAKRLEKNFRPYRSSLGDLDNELRSQEKRLEKVRNKAPADVDEIRAQTEAVTAARAAARAAAELTFQSMIPNIREVLSEEQWTKLNEMRSLQVYAAGEDGVTYPELIRGPLPEFTQEAIHARISGIVVIQVMIRKDGHATPIKIIHGLGYGLDESAINKIGQEWHFKPATKDGKPVDVLANLSIGFSLLTFGASQKESLPSLIHLK